MTKIVASRLKNVLTKLIGPTECNFVPRRQISYNILVAQEVLDDGNKERGCGFHSHYS